MRFRVITVGAVLVAWLIIYLLGFVQNPLVTLIPIAVLAFFQIGETRYLKNFSGRK